MQSSQQQIIARVSSWLQAGQPVWLCTIARTWGSSPRPPGAMMACTEDGQLLGSISGGCIEEDFLRQVKDGSLRSRYESEGGRPMFIRYGETAEEQARLKLPCGGQLHVLLEFIPSASATRLVFRGLRQDLERHKRVGRVVDLRSGETAVVRQAGGKAVVIRHDGEAGTGTLTHHLSPMYRLLLLGAGDVTRYVAEMALALEYEVTVCDPRPDYISGWQLHGVRTTSRLPDDVVRERFSNPYSGIIALAHDPRVDDMALMEALKTEAFYVGAMGSARTSAARRKRLPELGVSEEELANLHAPVGLPIASKTPAEIAISIMAEVTARRHGLTTLAPQEHLPERGSADATATGRLLRSTDNP